MILSSLVIILYGFTYDVIWGLLMIYRVYLSLYLQQQHTSAFLAAPELALPSNHGEQQVTPREAPAAGGGVCAGVCRLVCRVQRSRRRCGVHADDATDGVWYASAWGCGGPWFAVAQQPLWGRAPDPWLPIALAAPAALEDDDLYITAKDKDEFFLCTRPATRAAPAVAAPKALRCCPGS